MREDLQILRSLPGVAAATTINAVPLSGGGSSTVSTSPSPARRASASAGNYFEVDEQGIDDARRQAGRRPQFRRQRGHASRRATARTSRREVILITRRSRRSCSRTSRRSARPCTTASSQPVTVVGIIERMHGSWPSWDKFDHVVLHPGDRRTSSTARLHGACQARPARRDDEGWPRRRSARSTTAASSSASARCEYVAAITYADDRAMAVYLTRRHRAAARHRGARHLRPRGVQRQHAHQADRHAPGRRRAAHRHRAVLPGRELADHDGRRRSPGCVLALLLGYWLSTTFELPRLKLYYLVAGAVGLWVGRPGGGVRSRRVARRWSRRRSPPARSETSSGCATAGEAHRSSSGRNARPHHTGHRRQRGRAHGARGAAVARGRAGRVRGHAARPGSNASRAGGIDLVIQDMNFQREATSGEEGIALFRSLRAAAARPAGRAAHRVDAPRDRGRAGQGRRRRLPRQALGQRAAGDDRAQPAAAARRAARAAERERLQRVEQLARGARGALRPARRRLRERAPCTRWCSWRRRWRAPTCRC